MKLKLSALLALLLALCMALSMVSCSKDGKTDETKDGIVNTDVLDPNFEYVPPDVNYDGKDITIASYSYDGAWMVLDYNVALKDDVSTVVGESITKRNLKVEEELGININLYALEGGDRGNSKKIQNAIQTGEQLFDFALPMGAGIAPMLQTQGMLVDLNTVKTLDLSHSWWNQNANEEYSLYGKQYTAVGDICFFNLTSPIVTYFSKDMVKDNGLEDPYVLAEQGKWTLEKMKELSVAVSSDNGDGVLDHDDTFGLAAESDSLLYLLFASDVRLTNRDQNGNVVPAVYDARGVNAVDKIIALLQDDSITRSNQMQWTEQGSFHADYAIPKMAKKEMLFMSFQLLGGMDMSAEGVTFGVVPCPKYDVLQENYITYGNSWFSDHLIIPAGSLTSNLEIVGYVIESMSYYAQQYITPAVVEQSVSLRGVTDEVSVKWINTVLDNQVFDIGYIFDWGGLRAMFPDIAKGNEEFASAYEKREETIISAIEQTMIDLRA